MKSLWSSEPIIDDEIVDEGGEGTKGAEGGEGGDGGEPDKGDDKADDKGGDGGEPDKGEDGKKTDEKVDEKVEVDKPALIDPFEGWDDAQKQLFETFKKGDLNELKTIINEMTADYDSQDDETLLREYVKRTNPKWTAEMVDSELVEKYGLGVDEDDFSESELLKFKKALIKDADKAREYLNDIKSKIKLPEVTPVAVEKNTEPDVDLEASRQAWEKAVESGFGNIKKESFKVVLDEEGKAVEHDIDFDYSDEDRDAIRADMSTFNIENDFKSRYVSDDAINTEKLMRDRFLVDNIGKIVSNAFKQGLEKGSLAQHASLKNIDFKGENRSGFVDEETDSVAMAKFFLGRK